VKKIFPIEIQENTIQNHWVKRHPISILRITGVLDGIKGNTEIWILGMRVK